MFGFSTFHFLYILFLTFSHFFSHSIVRFIFWHAIWAMADKCTRTPVVLKVLSDMLSAYETNSSTTKLYTLSNTYLSLTRWSNCFIDLTTTEQLTLYMCVYICAWMSVSLCVRVWVLASVCVSGCMDLCMSLRTGVTVFRWYHPVDLQSRSTLTPKATPVHGLATHF